MIRGCWSKQCEIHHCLKKAAKFKFMQVAVSLKTYSHLSISPMLLFCFNPHYISHKLSGFSIGMINVDFYLFFDSVLLLFKEVKLYVGHRIFHRVRTESLMLSPFTKTLNVGDSSKGGYRLAGAGEPQADTQRIVLSLSSWL